MTHNLKENRGSIGLLDFLFPFKVEIELKLAKKKATISDLILSAPLTIEQHPVAVYLAGLNTKDGRRTMRQTLDKLAEIMTGQADAFACNWGAVRFQHVMAARAVLMERYRPATVNKYLSALRGVMKAAWLLGYLSAEDYHKAVSIQSVRNQTLPAGREMERTEILQLLQACQQDDTVSGRRDAAIIAILYGTGLRRAEITQLMLADYDAGQQRFIVHGKGQKERYAYMSADVQHLVKAWLEERGNGTGPFFCPISKAKRILPRQLSTQAIYYILQKRGEEAELAHFSPHDLRRTYVSTLLDKGVDISTVSRMAGHANIQTTTRYDRRADHVQKQAAEGISLSTSAEDEKSS